MRMLMTNNFSKRAAVALAMAGCLAGAAVAADYWIEEGIRDAAWPSNCVAFATAGNDWAALASNGGTLEIGTAAELGAFAWWVENGGQDFQGITVAVTNTLEMAAHRWWAPGMRWLGGFNDSYPRFRGAFDGGRPAGFAIRDLNEEVTIGKFAIDQICFGLFGHVGGGGAVKNVALENVRFDVAAEHTLYVAGIAGFLQDATVSNCVVRGGSLRVAQSAYDWQIRDSGLFAGGIAAFTEGFAGIVDCENTAGVTAENRVETPAGYCRVMTGGIVGEIGANGLVLRCVNGGDVDAVAMRAAATAGGIAGNGSGVTAARSRNTGTVVAEAVEGAAYAGGIFGQAGDATVEACLNRGATGTERVAASGAEACAGGVAGVVLLGVLTGCENWMDVTAVSADIPATSAGGIAGKNTMGLVVNCSHRGGVVASAGAAGGIAGDNDSMGEVVNCFVGGGTINGAASSGGVAGMNSFYSVLVNCSNNGGCVDPAVAAANRGGIVGSTDDGIGGDIVKCYYMTNALAGFNLASAYGVASPGTSWERYGTPPGTLGGGLSLLLELNDWVEVAQGGVYNTLFGGTAALETWAIVAGQNDGYPVFGPRYTVTLHPCNGDPSYDITVTCDQPMPDGNPVPVKAGHIFLGYLRFAADNGTNTVVFYYDDAMASARDWDIHGHGELFGAWIPEAVTDDGAAVVFHGNGGFFEFDDGLEHHIEEYRETLTAAGLYVMPASPVRDGYRHTGWNTSPAGDGDPVTALTPFDHGTSPQIVYATWELDDGPGGDDWHWVIVSGIKVDTVNSQVQLEWPEAHVRVSNPKFVICVSFNLEDWLEYEANAPGVGVLVDHLHNTGLALHEARVFSALLNPDCAFFKVKAVGQ